MTRRGTGILVALVALVAAGASGAAWLASGSGGAPPGRPTPTDPVPRVRAPRGSVPTERLLAALPLLRSAGRILYTTPACRLGIVEVATGRITVPRPDVTTCAARFGGRTAAVALVEPKERTNRTTLTRLAGGPAGDRTIRLPGLLEDLAISPRGEIAACVGGGLADAARTTLVVTLDGDGVADQVPGCNPAWWDGRLAWIDRRSRLVVGSRVIALGRSLFPETIGASTDGRVLAVLSTGGSDTAVVSVLRAGSTVPVHRLVLREPPALSSPTIRIASDGAVLALRGDAGQWTLYRTDSSVPPARDVAGEPVSDVAFAPDSRAVGVLAGRRLVFLDPETLGPVSQLPVRARTIDWQP